MRVGFKAEDALPASLQEIPLGRDAGNASSAPAKPQARAFTLVELLVVIALTGLLLALIFGPLIQGFRLTNRARAYSQAQDATRFGIEQLRRELSQAAYVFDNTSTPIILPLGPDKDGDGRPDADDRRDPIMYPKQYGYNNPRPTVLFAKIDFMPSATKGVGPGIVIDPTTDKQLGGAPVSVPGSPGRRVVRYFVGLRNPLTRDGKPAFYENVYEFPRSDSNTNLFVLYRAEFDPTDRNLIDSGQTIPAGPGGFNDPNFFYNTTVAPNGRSYAENWRDAASPILSTPNLDLISWRRDSGRNIIAGSPFQLNASFAPATTLSDTATPGFLTNANADAPGAVPTLYTAQNGLWTLPFTVTIYRAATQSKGVPLNGDDPYGSIKFIVEQYQPVTNSPVTRLRVLLSSSAGSLTPINNRYWWLYDPTTGKVFIHTQQVSLQIDASRGRIETGFAPFPVEASVPRYLPAGADPMPINLQLMVAGPDGNIGSLYPLVFRQNTRCDVKDLFNDFTAGQVVPITTNGNRQGTVYVPADQGILGTTLSYPLYYPATKPLAPFAAAGTSYQSPFVTLGTANADGTAANTNNFQGILLAPGTEIVLGPDNEISRDGTGTPITPIMNTYYRVPTLATLNKAASTNTPDPLDVTNRRYVRTTPLNYQLSQDLLDTFASPALIFDEKPSANTPDAAAGLPARVLPAKALPQDANVPEGELRVTYLWQDNYSRDRAGRPLNVARQSILLLKANAAKSAETIRAEADVIKLDYATRALINVLLGPRVYDTSTGQPQAAQVVDKIAAGNVAR